MITATLNSALPNKLLLGALLITVALTLWAFLQEESPEGVVVELAKSRSNRQTSNTNKPSKQEVAINMQDGAIAWQRLKRKPLENPVENPFKVHSWLVVPPIKKVKPAPPPIPTAPPAPFTYMGKYEETPATTQFFLMANGKLYSATQGKNINTQWRLDAEDANSLRLTYLPLNLPQVLSKTARPIMPAVEPINAEINL